MLVAGESRRRAVGDNVRIQGEGDARMTEGTGGIVNVVAQALLGHTH